MWVPALTTDARDEWREDVLSGGSVEHFWDGGRVSTDAFGGASGARFGIVYDVYLLYDGGAEWRGATAPKPRSAGAPVIGVVDRLARDVRRALGE